MASKARGPAEPEKNCRLMPTFAAASGSLDSRLDAFHFRLRGMYSPFRSRG
jgi:hypothetical protein